jgi:hypothetical protein
MLSMTDATELSWLKQLQAPLSTKVKLTVITGLVVKLQGMNMVIMTDAYLSYTAGGDMVQLPATANTDFGMSKCIGTSQGYCGNVAMCDQVKKV